jgi:hypothetical protein
MAAVEVWVDDAVRGNLPGVCVKTGCPADGLVRVEHEHGSLGLAWLLVFLGPIGWIVLLALLATNCRELFTVRLPYSNASWERERALRRGEVRVDLDASRRWVSLRRVHPMFADAVRRRDHDRNNDRDRVS